MFQVQIFILIYLCTKPDFKNENISPFDYIALAIFWTRVYEERLFSFSLNFSVNVQSHFLNFIIALYDRRLKKHTSQGKRIWIFQYRVDLVNCFRVQLFRVRSSIYLCLYKIKYPISEGDKHVKLVFQAGYHMVECTTVL